MKPLGKAVKVELDTHQPVQKAVDELPTDYHSTPHPATGLVPGVACVERSGKEFKAHVYKRSERE